MSKLLDQLLDAPDAHLLIEQVQEELKKESEQRKAFYDWIREDQKAEFINGEIIMHSPVKRMHWNTVKQLSKLMDVYAAIHDLGEVATEKALIALTRNDYEPDICFWLKEKAQDFTNETMLHPAPDLIVEVLSKGTTKIDRGIKFTDYAAHGVGEYWIIDPHKEEIEQYFLDKNNEYKLNQRASGETLIESLIIKGFTIPVNAVFESKANLKALQLLLSNS